MLEGTKVASTGMVECQTGLPLLICRVIFAHLRCGLFLTIIPRARGIIIIIF